MPKPSKNSRRGGGNRDGGDDMGSIFDHFANHRPELVDERTPRTQTRDDPTKTVDVNGLLGRIEALERTNSDLSTRLTMAQMAPAPAPQQRQSHHVDPAQLRVNTEGLPDPVEKPAEYNAEMARRINAALDGRDHARAQQAAEAASSASQGNALWSRFAQLYPDWAGNPDQVEFIATKVIQDAQARGMDTERYITAFADTFCKDVATRLEQTFGPLEPDEDDEDDDEPIDPAPRRRSRVVEDDDDEDDGRTAGIFGGVESGGKPAKGGNRMQPGDMIKDIQDLQRQSGFF